MDSVKTKYFNSLTGLRFLAATLVFVYHNRKYWRADLHPEILRFVNEFHVGVSLFFVLSGFLIAYTYYDEPLSSARKYGKYFLIRLARIMPIYWLVLTAYYLDPAFGKYNFSLLTYSLFHAFSNLRGLEGIAQAWSLNVEMSFYILAPFLYFLLRKKCMYLILALIVIIITTILVGNIWSSFGNSQQFFYPTKFVINSTFAGRSVQFLAGMLLAYGLRENKFEFFSELKIKHFWDSFCLQLLPTPLVYLKKQFM